MTSASGVGVRACMTVATERSDGGEARPVVSVRCGRYTHALETGRLGRGKCICMLLVLQLQINRV